MPSQSNIRIQVCRSAPLVKPLLTSTTTSCESVGPSRELLRRWMASSGALSTGRARAATAVLMAVSEALRTTGARCTVPGSSKVCLLAEAGA